MGIGYLLGAIAAFLYAGFVGYFGGIKKNAGLIRLVKAKIGKNMKDQTAANWCIGMSIFMLVLGIFLIVFGLIQA
ncbi:MAG: hypothetical protein K8Q99_04100 [Acholeplasmataceae bacterium]|nr:hypothetical protein [Acholeplasmataceae bacterium]